MPVIFLTSGTSWVVPGDWDSANNSIVTIGGGGGAGGTLNPGFFGAGGGGAAYSNITNLTLTPAASISYVIGAAGTYVGTSSAGTAGGDTWFNGASLAASSVGA